MPCGKVNSGDFRKGTPITLPHEFGTPVNVPEPQGNVMPQSNATLNSNPVTWTPSSAHYGNMPQFSMQAVPPIVIVEQSSVGTVTIPITDLDSFSGSKTLTYSGAPVGVTIVFTPNPATNTSSAAVTVGAAVPEGKYTITIIGTVGTVVETTNIHLVVVTGSAPPPPDIQLLVSAQKTIKAGGPVTTSAIDTTGATLIVAAVASYYGTNTVVDSAGNTWHALTEYGAGGQGDTVTIFYAFNPTTSATHTFSGDDLASQGFTSIMVAAFSGTDATAAVFEAGTDKGHAQTNGNPVQPGSVVVATIGDLYITAVGGYANATLAIDSGFTIITQDVLAANSLFAGLAYLLATDLVAVNPTWTPTGSSGTGIGTAIAGFAAA